MRKIIKYVIFIILIVLSKESIAIGIEGEDLPHYDQNGIAYITYEDFGAKGDGEYDDFIAIKEAHEIANKYNYEVRAEKGKIYHIWGLDGKTINIATNVNWNNATFIIHDEDIQNYDAKSKYLFTICKTPKETIIENPEWTIGKSTKNIKEIKEILENLNKEGYKQYFCVAENEDKKQYIRYGANANEGEKQQDYFLIYANGNVLNDIAWDFDKLTNFKIYPITGEELEIKNGNFITNANTTINPSGKYVSRNICVLNTSNVTLSRINHTSSNKDIENSAYYGFIFTKFSSNVHIKDCELLTRKDVGGRSTYDLVLNYSVNVKCENITSNDIHDEDRWGIVQTAYCKDVFFENCKLNRIDAHQGIYNLTIKNCDIGFRGLTLIGQGEANIINTTVTSNAFIDLRYDYGSTWNGNINIINCIYKYQGQYAPKLFNFKFQYDDAENKILHNFGYECKFPNVYIENLDIDFENASNYKQVYIIPNFSSMLGEPYYGNANYWPKYINVNGYRFINAPKGTELKLSVMELDKDENKKYNYIIMEGMKSRGDIDFDGELTVNDLALLKLCLIDKEELETDMLADIDRDEKITINDMALLKLILIGKKDNIMTVESVERMKSMASLKVGDLVKTEGYYLKNDDGQAKYEIINKTSDVILNDGTYIGLNNGLVAKMIIENDTVNVKQFGAKGDRKTNDSQAIEKALNSEIKNVVFPKAQYKITEYISLKNGNVNVLGNNSTVFTDNDYKPNKYSEFLFKITGNNYSFENLRIEARETKEVENLYIAQVYVGSTNVQFKSCDFIVPETTSSKHVYNNVDLYTGWHNVLIDNCNFYLAHDGSAGGCIWIRDFYNRGASDLVFKNNTCYKKCHDEILAVFSGTVENVEITNNKFIMPESTDPSVMCFTLGSVSSKVADNIIFEDNYIECVSKMELFVLKNSSNVSIKNNNIKYTKQNIEFNNYLVYIPENNVTNLKICDNNIKINNESNQALNAILITRSQDVEFASNTITVNSGIKEAFSEGANISNNNITFNGSVHVIANRPREFNNNKIVINGQIDSYFQYFKGNTNWESNIKNNEFEYNFDEITKNSISTVLIINGEKLNNHIITFEKNEIRGNKINAKRNYLYNMSITDETPQTIKFISNEINGYDRKTTSGNKAEHEIIFI